jgi:hypothetical protein
LRVLLIVVTLLYVCPALSADGCCAFAYCTRVLHVLISDPGPWSSKNSIYNFETWGDQIAGKSVIVRNMYKPSAHCALLITQLCVLKQY